jgi:hypothetical protein
MLILAFLEIFIQRCLLLLCSFEKSHAYQFKGALRVNAERATALLTKRGGGHESHFSAEVEQTIVGHCVTAELQLLAFQNTARVRYKTSSMADLFTSIRAPSRDETEPRRFLALDFSRGA